MAVKNEYAKMRPRSQPYEVWMSLNGQWVWKVLKKWQSNDDKPYARWHCWVESPFASEQGDVYVSEVKRHAVRVDQAAFEEVA